jgi:hypothetical protein
MNKKWVDFLRDLNEGGRMHFRDADMLKTFLLSKPEIQDHPEVIDQLKSMNTVSEMQKLMFKLYVDQFTALTSDAE